MAIQTVFKRYELKYLLTQEQKQTVLQAMAEHMELDQYGRTTIRNIYFDTENYRLIRRSIDKPAYKEKLRIRSYARAKATSTVFVELKKKYDSIVYKRRISLPEKVAMEWVLGKNHCHKDTQIRKEIQHISKLLEIIPITNFMNRYQLIGVYESNKFPFRQPLIGYRFTLLQ